MSILVRYAVGLGMHLGRKNVYIVKI